MATSGTVTITPESVDNGTVSNDWSTCGSLPSGTCYSSGNAWAFGRGAVKANISVNYYVNDAGTISFSYGSTSYPTYTWYVCANAGYHVDVDFSTDNSNWSTILSSFANQWQTCEADYNHSVGHIADVLVSDLGTYTLPQSGYIRIRMWTQSACPTCGGVPTRDVWPNAFPSDAASIPTAVPVYVEVDWQAKLQYDATGGSGAPAAQTRTVSASTTSTSFTVSNTVPTKANHRFDGWIYGGTVYHGGDTFTVQKSNPTITLKAVWTEFYRPGATLYSADEYHVESPVWYSNHKTNGACHIRTENNTWQEMRTIDGASNGQGDPPLIYRNDSLYNQKKLGKTS